MSRSQGATQPGLVKYIYNGARPWVLVVYQTRSYILLNRLMKYTKGSSSPGGTRHYAVVVSSSKLPVRPPGTRVGKKREPSSRRFWGKIQKDDKLVGEKCKQMCVTTRKRYSPIFRHRDSEICMKLHHLA